MLTIKLKKARSFARDKYIYHIIVIKKTHKVHGKIKEGLGFYAPLLDTWNNRYVFLDVARLAFWLKRGAVLEPKIYKIIAPLIGALIKQKKI